MSKTVSDDAKSHISPFEAIRRVDPESGNEFWSSRDFAEVLNYDNYRNFERVIEKAKLACSNSGHPIEDHFVDADEMIAIGKGGKRAIKVVLLSRYACYLVIQNSDPRKEIVAVGQTYFAIQTRRQELTDQEQLLENEQRLLLREDLRLQNSQLADAAMRAGVIEPIDYAIFQNHGYRRLYNGLDQAGIHRHKGLKKSQRILTIWARPNWRRIGLGLPKLRTSCAGKRSREKRPPMQSTFL